MKRKTIKFTVVRERHSTYRVENGQTLRTINMVADIYDTLEDNGDGAGKGQLAMRNTSYVLTPPDVDRYDVKYTEGNPTDENHIRELEFETEDEPINIYETGDFIIMVYAHVEKIFLTDKMDASGDPILRFVTQGATSIIPRPTPDSVKSLEQDGSGAST